MLSKTIISDFEDKILNPLNDILLLSYDTESYEKIRGEIDKILSVLEEKNLICKRQH